MSRETDLAAPMEATAVDNSILSHEEWRAVEVALRDAETLSASGDIAGGGRLARAWHWLTGFEPPRKLADPRLDAIRRFVWTIRRHGARAMEMRPELRTLGLSAAQVDTLARIAA